MRIENKSSPREAKWGVGVGNREGCRESEAPETQVEALFNPVLGGKGPRHQLLLCLWESKCAVIQTKVQDTSNQQA